MNGWFLFAAGLCMGAHAFVRDDKDTMGNNILAVMSTVGPIAFMLAAAEAWSIRDWLTSDRAVSWQNSHLAGVIGAALVGVLWMLREAKGPAGGLTKPLVFGSVQALALGAACIVAGARGRWWYVPAVALTPGGLVVVALVRSSLRSKKRHAGAP